MANETIIHGDVEAAVVSLLSSDTLVTNLVPTTNISTSLVGYSAGAKWIEVSLEGGSYIFPKFYRPRIDIYVYASTRSQAIAICHAINAVLFKKMGDPTVYNGVRIANVKSELMPTRVPDKQTESPRYVMSYRLTVTP